MATKYAVDIAEVLEDIREAGGPILFPGGTPRVYLEDEDRYVPGAPIVVRGYALGDMGQPDRLAALGLVGVDTETFWLAGVFVNNATDEVVLFDPGAGNVRCTWAGKELTIRDVDGFAPDGTPMLFNVVASR